MIRFVRLAVGLALLGLVAPGVAQARQKVPGQYIVVLKDGVDVADVVADHRRGVGARVLHRYTHALRGYSARLSTVGLAAVERDPRVQLVVQDERAKVVAGSKPSGGNTGSTGWPPPPPGGTLPTGVNRIDADVSPTAGAGDGTGAVDADIAVYDTGVDFRHPDLNVVGGVNCLAGQVSSDGTYGDEYGHGTHVAGIAAARDDANGVVGVAPGARLWSVRIAGPGGLGTSSTQLCGIDWVTANGPTLGIEVVNASVALVGKPDDGNCGYTAGDVMHQAICRSTAAGIDWVFAAGNGGGYYNNVAGASYNEVMAVTSVADSDGKPGGTGPAFACSVDKGTLDDKHAISSNYATSASDFGHTVAGPGVCIQSTWPGGGYETRSGTSMASPAVAGTVALCMAAGRCAGTPAEVIQEVHADAAAASAADPAYGFTGDPLRPITGRYYGHLVRASGY